MLFNAWKGMKEEFNHPVKIEDGVEIEFSDAIDLEHYQRIVNETIQNIYEKRGPPNCRRIPDNPKCCDYYEDDDCCRATTDIVRALDTSLKMMFQSSSGMREDAEQVAVLITDGWDYHCTINKCTPQELKRKYNQLAKEFNARKIRVLVIGVGDVDKKSLLLLVQSPEHFFQVESFDGLKDNVTQLIGAIICEGRFILIIMIKRSTPNEFVIKAIFQE